MKENFIGLAFLTLLIALFFLCVHYISDINPIIFPFIYVAWCALAVYSWEHGLKNINSVKDWLVAVLSSIFGFLFLILIAVAEKYMTSGLHETTASSVAGHADFPVFTVMAAFSFCPGLTFIALAGAARELFMKKDRGLG